MRWVSATLLCLLARTAHAAEDPEPYKAQIVIADTAALAVIPGGVIGLYYAANQRFDPAVIFASVPVCILAPIIHLTHHRPVAALVSFLGWTASATLTWTIIFGARFRVCGGGCEDSYGLSMGFGIPSAIVGSAAMMLTDAALAHDMQKPSAFRITPNGFAGTF